ncbi:MULTISPECIES: porin [unclassified Bradyrhizobium]|uniref:porin n=1 Tax=unclassified Bradyrhizobium TaxID=2631580 RepID=UPI001BA5514D|nr:MULTISPECIES: porin [unclassified Bradyrhizobium]MBR1201891.1 porin [Bradyrhizobium sp. AUGA SZCCT0124]MBR1311540.1 porin [Bradyrhizobium sp. AUGA SZCCT0051]MBR1338840.1 porin [Bradyrhizobium sp. AUGA SZCCT0105]MBR1353414.1 porin [Bradyrhizobium sp. AUGA SZCCT0045]
MKMVKSLILGSAAALVAVGGAQAADLPVKAKAVEYVKICSLYGPGFYYIPGTDTCIKLGGYLRADVVVNSNSDHTGNTSGAGGANNRFTNGYTWRSREDLNIDTRTATEYGVVRTFFDATFSWTSDTYAGQGNGATVYSPIGAVQAPNNANSGAVAGGTVGVYYAFIQFAGFTMGKAVSQFSAPWANYPGNNFDGLVGGGGTITGVNQFTYTAQFGNGVSLSLSAQDQTAYYQAGVNNILAGGAYGTSDYAGTISPDLVAMLRVDQAWGLFQASFAAHDNHAAYYGGTELTGHPDDKWGWAGQLALSIKNIPTGPGDTINVQGVYTNGATRYNIQDLAGSAGANTIYGGTGLPGAYQSVGIGVAPDSVFGAIGGVNTGQQLVTTWGFRGAYVHNWSPYWNTSIYGAYAGITYNDTAKTLLCGVGGVGGSVRTTLNALGGVMTTCNPDYNIAQIGTQTQWTPVKNLTFTADLTYTHLDQKYAGTVSAPSAAIGKPAALYELKDQNTVTLLLRAQRNW